MELLVALPRFCRQRTELGTCSPVVTWKLPHHTWGTGRGERRLGSEAGTQGHARCPGRGGALTVKAGSSGCVNLALKVCSSCLVRAL